MHAPLALSILAVCLAAAQTPPEPLPAPRLVGPPANATDLVQPVEFRWTAVDGAAGYSIQIARTSEFTPLLLEQTVSVRRFTIEVLPAANLWWRVRAVDSAGLAGLWSPVRRFEPRPLPASTPVFALTLTPAAVAGGFASDGLVTLAHPAPPGGATVQLSSSDPAAASVPRRVMIEAGESSTTFTVDTRQVADSREVRVTAASLGIVRTATMRVTPPPPPAELLSFSVNPSTLTGGNAARGTLTLSSAAPPPKGVAVKLAAGDQTLASVPESVTIPAGQRMASFPVKTERTGVSTSIAITAALNGVTRSASIRLEGAGSMFGLPAPEPQIPAERQTISGSRSVLFRWGSVPGAASYTLQVDGSGGFDGALVLSYTLPDLETRIAPFTPRLFWWRVRANDNKGAPGRWSTPRPFQVE